MYTRMFDEISDSDEDTRKVALECFRWMLYAKQSPSLEVLRVAVALLDSPETAEDLMAHLPPGEHIAEECRNLLQLPDLEILGPTSISPIHFSFLEYLENLPLDELRGNFWKPLADKRDAESVLACRCMEWLLLALPEELKETDVFDAYVHLSYPTKYFDEHAKCAINEPGESSAVLLTIVDRLLSADVGKLDSLVKLRLMRMPLGRWERALEVDGAFSRNYLLWISNLHLIPGLSSEWLELEIPKYALHFAVWFRPEALQRLLSNNDCVDELDSRQRTALSYACAKGCSASADALLRAGARLDADSWRTSPLGLAIQNDHCELVKTLLKAKASMRVPSDIEGLVPLMMATSLEMVQLLCEAQGSDIHATDQLGRSVLGHYIGVDALDRIIPSTQASRILEYLIDRGADMYARSKAKMSLVDFAACRINGYESLKFLLQRAPKLVDSESHEWTPLHWACRQGNAQSAEILLEHGSKMKKVTTLHPPQSWTPYEILEHYRAFPLEFNESTAYALGRLEDIETGPNLPSSEQIDYGSLKVTEVRRKAQCSLCAMPIFVCNQLLPPLSLIPDKDKC
jgi:ankyrin repeat protein